MSNLLFSCILSITRIMKVIPFYLTDKRLTAEIYAVVDSGSVSEAEP